MSERFKEENEIVHTALVRRKLRPFFFKSFCSGVRTAGGDDTSDREGFSDEK
jgi:hypothetical protein